MRNQNTSVRVKVSSFFMAFIRNKKTELLPYTQYLIAAFKDLLEISPEGSKYLNFDLQLNLFDVIGTLIGACPDQDQIGYLEAVLVPLMKQLTEIMISGRYKEDTPGSPFWISHIGRLIHTMGCISRVLPCENEEKAIYWRKALEIVLGVLSTFPNNDLIRDKTTYFIFNLVTAINTHLIPYAPRIISILLASANNPKQCRDLLAMASQWVTKYKDKILPFINDIFLSIAQKAVTVTSVPVTPNSEEENELQVIRRAFCLLLRAILSNNLAGVLISEKNAPHLPTVIKILLTTILENKDLKHHPSNG